MSDSNPTTDALVLDYVEASSQALKLAVDLTQAAQGEKQAAVSKVAQIAAQLRQAGLIDAHQEKEAAAQLSTHDGALAILTNILAWQKEASAQAAGARLGAADGEEGARPIEGSAHLKNANYVGYRAGAGEEKESDRAILRLIGR